MRVRRMTYHNTVQYRFTGAKKAVEWAKKNIKKVFENINKKVNKYVK